MAKIENAHDNDQWSTRVKLRKIYLTQSRKDAKEIANIIIYLGALASLRENNQFLF